MVLKDIGKGTRLSQPQAVADLGFSLLAMESEIDAEREHVWAIGLTNKNGVKYVELVSLGTLDESLIHPRELFPNAVHFGAARLIVMHNHPSGEVEISDADVRMTNRIVEAGKILGIAILDHIIIGNGTGRFAALKGAGVMPA